MPDKWTLTYTDANGRVAERTFDSENAFASGVRDRLNDLRASNLSAVLPNGTKLDENALREKYGRP